ncbi:MAG: hypothetical protein NHG36_10530 [Chromatiaceae bacterium]|nr:hypothetical protein [Candidatus Thioaporhodococcus sediminis]
MQLLQHLQYANMGDATGATTTQDQTDAGTARRGVRRTGRQWTGQDQQE